MMLVQSRYNLFAPLRDGRAVAYNAASGATALLEREELATLQNGVTGQPREKESLIRNLVYGGFLVDATIDELQSLEADYKRLRYDPSGMILTIAPTLACNFGCDYCFQGANKPLGRMSSDIQDAVLRFFESVRARLKRLHVTWYGGEPLLAQDVIRRLSDRLLKTCSEQGITYDAMIVTNGFKLIPQLAEELYNRRVKVAQVTIDGACDYHDRRRTLLGGQGTFDRIIENLRRVINETEMRISVRINIDSRNSYGIIGLLESFATQGFSHKKNFSVYFAPVEAITEGCHCVESVCMSKKAYASIETELHRRAFELGLASLPYARRFRGLCGAVRPNSYVVVPNGDLHKCWDTVSMPEMRIGSVLAPELLQTNERNQTWNTWTPFTNQTCRNCKILPTCAGSCAHKFINPEQTSGEAGSLPCPPWKYQVKERLVMLALQKGIIRREEYDADQISTDPREICAAAPDEFFGRPTQPHSALDGGLVTIQGAA
jgi:uncharacterized protein